MFGRGRQFDRIDLEAPGGHPGGQRARCRSSGAWCRIRGSAPLVTRTTARVNARRVCHFDEHFERVRPVHRHVHHLQLVFDSRHPAAVRDRRVARARCPSPADSEPVSRRKRRKWPGGLGGRHRSWHRDGARHGGIDLQHARGHLRSGRTRRGGVGGSAAAGSGDGDWGRHQHAGRVAARTQCVSSRSGSGASEGQVSSPDGWRKPHAPAPRGGVDGGRRRLSLDRQVDLVLRRLHLDRDRLAAARSDRCPLAIAGAAADTEVAPSRGRRARGRQPHPIAQAHVGCRGRANALAGTGHRPWRRRPRKLQLHRGLAEHRAESGPVRHGIPAAVRSRVQISAWRWRHRSRRSTVSTMSRRCEASAST